MFDFWFDCLLVICLLVFSLFHLVFEFFFLLIRLFVLLVFVCGCVSCFACFRALFSLVCLLNCLFFMFVFACFENVFYFDWFVLCLLCASSLLFVCEFVVVLFFCFILPSLFAFLVCFFRWCVCFPVIWLMALGNEYIN